MIKENILSKIFLAKVKILFDIAGEPVVHPPQLVTQTLKTFSK
jgi:hypothetical protein